MFILIDTNIWHFARVEPKEAEFAPLHSKAKAFLLKELSREEVRIALSAYQIAEILEIWRRSGISSTNRLDFLREFLSPKFFIKDLTIDVVAKATKDSIESNIHVYDYLVAYPLRGVVNQIYSADDHFQHTHFQQIGEVLNPLEPWILREGRIPQKQDE